jgi:hypothetical protein
MFKIGDKRESATGDRDGSRGEASCRAGEKAIALALLYEQSMVDSLASLAQLTLGYSYF